MIGLPASGEKKNPAPFSFSNTTGQSASTLVSTTVTPTGYDGALTAVASGSGSPGVRKNSSGSFGSSVVLFPGDVLNLQLTTAAAYNTATVATVTMGTQSASWSATTAVVTPGSQNFSTPGTFNFIPPVFSSMTVTVKGAGEAGGDGGGVSFQGKGVCRFTPSHAGANGAGSSFSSGSGPTMVAPGGKSTGAGVGSGGNSINDSNGGAGGIGSAGATDPDCGAASDGPNGFAGGRCVSIFSIGGLTVGANYTVVVGLRGGVGADVSANGSVAITWS